MTQCELKFRLYHDETKTKNYALTGHLIQASLKQKRMIPEFFFNKNVRVRPKILSK